MEDQRDIFSIELIKTMINILECSSVRYLKPNYGFRALVVYQLIEIDGNYLPLGRDYKPLGMCYYSPWADYHKYPHLLIPKERVNIENLSYDGIFPAGYFLFNDGNTPLLGGKYKKKYIEKVIKVFNLTY